MYRGSVGVVYGVFQVAVFCVFAASFQLFFYSKSAHFAINVVNFYLCWWLLFFVAVAAFCQYGARSPLSAPEILIFFLCCL